MAAAAQIDKPEVHSVSAHGKVEFHHGVPTVQGTDAATFEAQIASLPAAEQLFDPAAFIVVNGPGYRYEGLPERVKEMCGRVVLVDKRSPYNGAPISTGTGTLYSVSSDLLARFRLPPSASPMLGVLTNFHVGHYLEEDVGFQGVQQADVDTLGLVNVVLDFEVGKHTTFVFDAPRKPIAMFRSNTVEAGPAAGVDHSLDSVMLMFLREGLTPEEQVRYDDAVRRSLSLVVLGRADDISALAQQNDAALVAQYLIGHPLGCAKRVSSRHPALGAVPQGILPGGLARHGCASYGGNSGSPLMMLPTEHALALCASDNGHGKPGKEVSDALLARGLAARAASRGNMEAIHWGAAGSCASFSAIAVVMREHFH